MTNEEAIRGLAGMYLICVNSQGIEDEIASNKNIAINKAIEALDKQIPKKPILQHDVTNVLINNGELHYEWKQIEKYNWHCPVCNGVVGERIILPKGKVHDQRMKIYCEKCGQRME